MSDSYVSAMDVDTDPSVGAMDEVDDEFDIENSVRSLFSNTNNAEARMPILKIQIPQATGSAPTSATTQEVLINLPNSAPTVTGRTRSKYFTTL